ncbi:hypothetical protein AK812_SmicGene1573 [Symbiodinium microadriaticum]|uniref:Uncharacterized protein n=1 Tax=Symbiodinium microadriaticum TaxID=2951 RepID=A0A1Q9F3N3_SYMMI|nr:hypothetical protein AK812_SmicGene1573 [Symbiodinium microadriaticum]CAE7895504.1 unnamed protein product [Symbiodinium microadriaticum]CAE7948045.1 unnamed protein product [Symbiodinium sp. KB8]
MGSFRFAVVFATLFGATPGVAVRSNAETDNQVRSMEPNPAEDVNKDVKEAFCENFGEIEYKVKGKEGRMAHPCCTEAETCFGKEQIGKCQVQCTVEALAGIASRGLKSHERFWAPETCVKPPVESKEKELVAQQTNAAKEDVVVVAGENYFPDFVRQNGRLDMPVYDAHLTERLRVKCY